MQQKNVRSPQTLNKGIWGIEHAYNLKISHIYFLSQAKCKAAYFVLVLHHLRSVVIAVRGTETPEDLITDSLCRECALSVEDLGGLIKYLSLSLSLLVIFMCAMV